MRALSGPFTFDASSHVYRVGGIAVPGIHAVLRAGGIERGAPNYTQEHRDRGKWVHQATLLMDLGEDRILSPENPGWMAYFAAYEKFRAEVPVRWRKLEHPKVHRKLRYASIIDRAGLVSGRPAVLEIKTGGPAPFHGPQLAGADLLLSQSLSIGTRRRLAVYLFADGTYQLREYTNPIDYKQFLRAVGDYWKPAPATGTTGFSL